MKTQVAAAALALAAFTVSCVSRHAPTSPPRAYSLEPAGTEVTVATPLPPAPASEVTVVSPAVTPPPTAPSTGVTIVTPRESQPDMTQAQSLSDEDLITSVRHQFQRYGSLAGNLPNLTIVADNGTISLSGTVADRRDQQMISAMVRNTPGVVNVVDQTTLAEETVGAQTTVSAPPQPAPQTPAASTAPPPAPSATPTVPTPTSRPDASSQLYAPSTTQAFNLQVASSNTADRERGQRIVQTLSTEVAVVGSQPNVTVEVADDKVTLRGTVADEQQRQAILNIVQRVADGAVLQDELQVQQISQ